MSTLFFVLDFVSDCSKLPLHKESFSAYGILTPSGTNSSTRALTGLTISTVHFHRTFELLFQELRHMLKAWLDDFILRATNQTTLFRGLECFLLSARRLRCFSLLANERIRGGGSLVRQNHQWRGFSHRPRQHRRGKGHGNARNSR